MEKKTYKYRLQNIIRQLPWRYDTIHTTTISRLPKFNYQQINEEIERFKRLCNKEFGGVEILGMSWDDKNGMVLTFNFEYDEETLMHEQLTEIIEAFKKDELVKEELSETSMTDVGEMEIVKKLTIADDYRLIFEDLIGLGVLEETSYSDIFDTVVGLKSKEDVLKQLIRRHANINQNYTPLSDMLNSLERYKNADINLKYSDYVILDGDGEFVRFKNNNIVIYGDYVEAYNDVDPQGNERIVSCVELSEEKQEELIKFIKSVTLK